MSAAYAMETDQHVDCRQPAARARQAGPLGSQDAMVSPEQAANHTVRRSLPATLVKTTLRLQDKRSVRLKMSAWCTTLVQALRVTVPLRSSGSAECLQRGYALASRRALGIWCSRVTHTALRALKMTAWSRSAVQAPLYHHHLKRHHRRRLHRHLTVGARGRDPQITPGCGARRPWQR